MDSTFTLSQLINTKFSIILLLGESCNELASDPTAAVNITHLHGVSQGASN